MTAKEYLEQYRKGKMQMIWIARQIEKIETELGYHPIQLDDSGASHLNYREDKFAEKMAEVGDLYNDLNLAKEKLILTEGEIWKKVGQIEDIREQKVLMLRYLTIHPKRPYAPIGWRDIGFRMGYSAEGARHLHDRALKNFSKILKLTES